MCIYLRRLLPAFVIAIVGLTSLGCSATATSNPKSIEQPVSITLQQVTMDEAMRAWRSKEAIFIDVRTPEEYKQGHVPGAFLIPLSELDSRRAEVVKDKKVLLICRSGSRSAEANFILQKRGFTNTVSVNGGMNEWREAVEK